MLSSAARRRSRGNSSIKAKGRKGPKSSFCSGEHCKTRKPLTRTLNPSTKPKPKPKPWFQGLEFGTT